MSRSRSESQIRSSWTSLCGRRRAPQPRTAASTEPPRTTATACGLPNEFASTRRCDRACGCTPGSSIWVDAWTEPAGGRHVCKFKLHLVNAEPDESPSVELDHSRVIPTVVKIEVWGRDSGQMCRVRSNGQPALRPHHPVLSRRLIAHCSQHPAAVCTTQPGEARPDPVDLYRPRPSDRGRARLRAGGDKAAREQCCIVRHMPRNTLDRRGANTSPVEKRPRRRSPHAEPRPALRRPCGGDRAARHTDCQL